MQLSVIRNQTFDGLQNLKKLVLTNNDILQIQEGAFNGLHQLVCLDLRHNLITHVGNETFTGLLFIAKLQFGINYAKMKTCPIAFPLQ